MKHAATHRAATLSALRWLAPAISLLSLTTSASAQSPTFVQYDLLTHGPPATGNITAGPDGAMWLVGVSVLYRITAAGAVTSYATPGLRPYFITPGPDGALWFTTIPDLGQPPQIGRVTRTGEITNLYTISSQCAIGPSCDLGDIVTGPDGNLWFAEPDAGKIGQITTAGKLVEFPLKPHSSPWHIVPGPDGALWFAQWGGIGRITTDGAVSEYPVGNHSIVPHIAAGPDGALWFTYGDNTIGQITTDGRIRQYNIGSGTTHAVFEIATGPDGALWLNEPYANGIVRMTTDGTVSEYPTPFNCPIGLATGTDGALWFYRGYCGGSDEGGIVGRAILDVTSGSLSQLASGGGWKTTITITNSGDASVEATLNFFADSGAPLTLPISSPAISILYPGATETASTFQFSVKAHGTTVLETELPGQSAQAGWAQLIAGSTVSASAVFRLNQATGPQEAVVPLETRNGSFVLPFDNTGFATGVAVANLAPIPASIPVTVWDESGALLGHDTIRLPPHGHTSFVLADANHSANLSKLTANRRGMVEFDRPPLGQISVIGIRACPTGAFTSIPVAMK